MEQARDLIRMNSLGEFPAQRTDRWLEIRKNMVTATNASSILDCNIYKSSYDLMIEKLTPDTQRMTNYAMEWGNMFEPIAIKLYEFMESEKNSDIGLVTHKKYPWLGASPDGVLTAKLLEIKCPVFRRITKKIPDMYWIQMQIQMEVCDMPKCDYFEVAFHTYKNITEYNEDDCK